MKNRSALVIIFFTVFIDLMGFGLLIPILPTFASTQLGANDFEIGIVVAVYSFIQFIFNPLIGKLSDKIGRRPVILTTLLITATSYIIFSFTNSLAVLIFSRILAGLGGSNIGAAQAYIADITTKEDRSKGMGLIGAAFGLGFVIGPFVGGLLSSYGYSFVGFGSAAFSFTAFLFALFMLKESNTNRTPSENKRSLLVNFKFAKYVFTHPQIGLLVSIFFIIIFSMANIYGTFAILGLKVYGFTDRQNGYLFGVSGIVSALIQGYFIRKISNKFKDRAIVLSGIFFMIIGLGFLPYGGDFLGVAIVIAVLSIGTGLLQPTIISLISKYAPEDQQGSVLGFNSSMGALARVLGPVWGGFAFDYLGYQFPFLTGAIFTFITFIVAYFLMSTKRMELDSNV